MRIISKFQDYYDTSLAYGHDEKLTYVRSLEEFPDCMPEEYRFMDVAANGGNLTSKKKKKEHTLFPFTVAFCGKIYRGVGTTYWKKDEWGLTDIPVTNHFYDLDSLKEYLDKYGLSFKEVPTIKWRKWNPPSTYPLALDLRFEHKVEMYFAEADRDSLEHLDFFVVRKLPIAVWEQEPKKWSNKHYLYLNCRLQNFHFGKVLSAPLAFQEIDMFLGGIVAGEDNPMVGISDKDLAEAKGFNCYSFRKEPTKRKRKRCRK